MKKTAIFMIAILCLDRGWAQSTNVSKVGVVAAPFLEIGIGSRAIGMGGAFVGTADDASALYWNPSGIARLERFEIILVHTEWIADMRFDFAGVVVPLGRFGSIGGSITSLGMDDMMVRTEERPEGTGEYFSAGDLCVGLSFAVNLTNRFSIGCTGKYIQQRIWKENAWGMAVDLGTLFTTGFHGLRIGATLSNFGTDMKMSGKDLLVYHDLDPDALGNNERIFADLTTDSWSLPLTFQAGVAMEIFDRSSQTLTVAVDAVHPSDNTESIHVGCEYGLFHSVFLRAGYRNLFLRDGEEGLALGGGMKMNFLGNVQLRVDYAFSDFGRLENVHRFSLQLAL